MNIKCLMICLTVILDIDFIHCSVTYDRKAIIINGRRRILMSGSIHYPRSTPDMWEGLIRKAKAGGLDAIDTYVFWNVHEPSQGNYNFEGRYDLVKFIKTAQKAGLYVVLRIGPYICAEWNFGGFPVWLKYVPGISFRTDNEPFKKEMQRFVEKIVGLMKSENLFETQGGPIILSQIENEYGRQGELFGSAGNAYTTWAASMAVGLQTGVPWFMCKDPDTPDPMINTCNGFYCNKFSPNKPYKPIMWTESWTGWLTEFGGTIVQRPVQDLAFAVAQFVQMGGSFVNYYMYHGGTNFGHTAGGPFITTSYDYDAPLDEYGLIRQPKYGHLKELHRSIRMCEQALVSADPVVTSLGDSQKAYVFSAEGKCAAFLTNYDKRSPVRLLFNKRHYNLLPWSISILPDCRNEVFNTAKVGVQTSHVEMLPTGVKIMSGGMYMEDMSLLDDSSTFNAYGLLDQMNVTRDSSDYLWYKTSVNIDSSERILSGSQSSILKVKSAGHALHVFINGQYSGAASGDGGDTTFTFMRKVKLYAGLNTIALLSIAVGLPNKGVHYEEWNSGVLGPVTLYGLNRGTLDLSRQRWTYQVGMKGEVMNLASPHTVSAADWTQQSLISQTQKSLTWHKASFDAPEGDEPLALDMGSMGKGEVWINGQSIGRYWLATARGNCTGCNYAEQFRSNRCQSGCGQPTQKWYHVPRSWLRPTHNLLVLFEEVGGDPSRISLVKRLVTSICADVTEYHPTIKNWSVQNYGAAQNRVRPKVHLQCGTSQYISSIKFASFGTPTGTCGGFQQGLCHSFEAFAIIEKMCIGKVRCSVSMSYLKDPCPQVLKRFVVEAVCAQAGSN